MGHGIVSGVNWSIEGDAFTIFGQCGWIDGRKWRVPADVLGGVNAPIDPAPIKKDIEAIIAGDIRDGNGDKIAYVGVGPFQGLLLALEGVITTRMLQTATEAPDRIIMDVRLSGAQRKLVVLKDARYTMATFDQNDEVV